MALLIGDNFSYNGKKPNFERDSFETLAILKAFPEANIDNGHIAYCKETNKHYIFNDSNSADPLTGKWRELESEFSNLIDSSDLEAYLTKDEAQSTYQPIGDYVLKSEIPSLDGYATEVWVNSQGFLKSIPEEYITESELDAKDYVTNTELASKNYLTEIPSEYITETELEDKNYATKDEIPDISNLALKSEIPTKVSQLENDSNYLTSVPDNYVTDTELQEAISGVQFELPIASNSVLGGIKVGAGLNITKDGILSATGGGTADAVNWENVIGRPTNLSQFTNDSGFITSDDLPDLSNYATQSWVQEQGYLTSIPDNYITETELTEAINTVKYTLPIASTDVLGGIKVGAGLSINAETGVLSATGGGTADSVDWNNVFSKPDWITNTKPTYNYTEIEGDIPTSKLPIATTTSVGVVKIGSGLTIDGEGLLSSTISVISELDPVSEQPVRSSAIYEALNNKQDTLISGETLKTINGTSLLGSGNIVIESGGSGSGITDVLDNKTYARTQGSWVDLTDWLTWAEYD